MKKTLSLLLILLLTSFGILSAQNNDAEIKAIKRRIQKSNEAIQNPKKSAKYKTWVKRANIFMDAYSANIKYLAVGAPANTIPLLGISENSTEPFFGKPQKIISNSKYDIWIYPKVKIYVKNGKIDHWIDLQPIDSNALIKAYKAYKKAIELDKKHSFVKRKSTKKALANLRELLMNKAVTYYYAKNNNEALNYIEKSIDLFQYPRTESDTLIKAGAYYYYAGIFAFGAKKLDKAKNYFLKAINEKYEIGNSYKYLAETLYKLNDSTQAVKLLEEGAQKFPQEPDIIYSLIDYYTPRGQYDKAFKYLDKAIKLAPNNAILYIVKGNSYEKIYENLQKDYFKLLNIADSLDKEAFKNRFNQDKEKEIKNQENEYLSKKIPAIENKMNENFKKAVENYKIGISKKQDPNYYYTISYNYYRTAILDITEASNLRKLTDYINKLEKQASEYLNIAKNYGEKAYQLNPHDTYTMDLLSKIYFRLRMYKKSSEMKKKINEEKAKAANK
jgi:tetratricopeptide (TPR) repeat protein